MAAPPDPGTAFAEQSHLTYLVSAATNLDLENLFGDIESGTPILESIKTRDSLFFDETVEVVLILKAPWLEENAFQAQLQRLVLSVEAQVVNGSVSGHNSPPATDTIFKGTVDDVSDPFILVGEEESDSEEEATQFVYAVWKLPVFLGRPRMRLQSPSIVFTASASLKPDIKAELASGGGGYLPSGVPSGFNLLESFGSDPLLNGVKPRLSALRVSKVAPLTRQQDLMQHIRAMQQLKLDIHPILHARVRFTRPNTAPATPAVIAMLEADFTPFFECKVTIDKIHLSVSETTIKDLTDVEGIALPLPCVKHDQVTFLYHITPLDADALSGRNATRDLDISISATAALIPGICTPTLNMSWTASVDFTTPVNPGFGPTPGTSSIQRAHRPSQLSIGGGQAVTSLKSPSVTQPDALPSLEAATTRSEKNIPDLGVTMSFTAPITPIHVGERFSWSVYIVNRSTEKAARPPRKFALLAIPKRRKSDHRTARPLSSSSHRRGASLHGGGKPAHMDVADAVVDENVLHALQKNAASGGTDVVCLTADARFGPLAPGACHVVELQFIALTEGIVGLEAIRVVDLASQEHVDIRDLPMMHIEPARVS
ncbi:TRAPP trafficking subunit Trs65-domain-containing protein [Emericellopsis atlantica]|uniref:TRAPP trafficking subunit Trs65-domain-containing protein n=1 Tax=Emericellopsis atlantica TaxID=2614577 RepID=A0A9P7ZDQ4_9HYPO|nr:TRAPP trafficking subunit Trs65-domain-containing protein [Emericellopsis atlantica]KAG9249892.1 TRAPP trafficking subunit Trs65-domain-containing protein [Emericellopsis atlantica]